MSHTIRVGLMSLLLLFSYSTYAQSLTHLGQPPSQLVSLIYTSDRSNGSNECFDFQGFFRSLPNGTMAANRFRVPKGKFLIITDFVWVAESPTGFPEGYALRARLSSRNVGDGLITAVFNSSPVNLTSALAESTAIGGSDHILAGARVGARRILCADANSITGSFARDHSIESAEIYGYLVDK